MKIEFDRNEFSAILSSVGSVSEKRTTMPILGNLLLEVSNGKMTVAATDLEIAIASSGSVKVMSEGRVCTPAHQLADIVKSLPETLGKLETTANDWISLSSGKARFTLAGVSAEEFPKIPLEKDFSFSKIRTKNLQTGLEKTSFAMSNEEMRMNLNGILVETSKNNGKQVMRMVATDGHRLAMVTKDVSAEETIAFPKNTILPRKGVLELRRLLTDHKEPFVEASVSGGSVAFRVGRTTIFMKLVVGEFPDYSAVVPKDNKKKLMIQRAIFEQALQRVSLLSEGKSKCVRFGINPESVHLQAQSPELGEAQEDVPGEFQGGELNIGFNARYILDALSAMDGEQVLCELETEQSPGILRCTDDPTFLGVVMPMRI